jgi:hypothetical protein
MRTKGLRALAEFRPAPERENRPRTRYDTGPCPDCGRHVVADHARDAISHAEPVCRVFEAAMIAALGHRGRPDVYHRELGCLVPDLAAMKREKDERS